MSEHPVSSTPMTDLPEDQRASALFASLVVQYTNMALMCLGQVPHADTGKTETDLEAAQTFIGFLEMLETKTRNNLSAQEQSLLKQSLTTVRLAFVQAVENPPAPEAAGPASAAAATPSEPAAPDKAAPGRSTPTAEPGEAESRKKFFKKY